MRNNSRFAVSSFQLVAGVVMAFLAGANLAWGQARPVVETGIDVLAADGFKPLVGKRVGLITNPTGITRDYRSTVDALFHAPGVKLVALYGPEHGVRGDVPAGAHVGDSRDSVTGVPVYSLYGKTSKPNAEMLRDVDVLVYDIQDNGSRSYTYITTMTKCMEAAAEHNKAFVVLDRPNPLTGNRIEGRPLDLKFRSGVGYLSIPYVYGMTCGELARMINGEGWLANGVKCKLTVVPMRGWKRDMWFDETGLPWVPPSPHVPRADSSMFYAATGIMGELHVVNEGVGYPLPFELAGAPWIDAEKLAEELNGRRLPGVYFRACYYQPYYTQYEKQRCGGVQIHITDRDAIRLTPIQFHIMDAVRKLYPDQKLFGNKRDSMFDKVCGTDQIRQAFLDGKPIEEILKIWNSGLEPFMAKRAKYLMYK
ncbi:MAG TPA: DUF1343 domain-containing protein [Phycisphaerae bacterium]|jgi:uncharacterized protein YbbC (DUF1343 family)|nr:DUF1343 domain-containing protein [Phycisphaerae bacterium]HOJ54096.1 DUF1343 domain-containing protein [Phycisphaerae bacterium]HOL25611.1 DUF1343 domain-containing protein [Phycisphaerae bacterium]HPP22752.1 DUF1343 domain-containing protein [Phycisphaerae bacterium]HPU31855.1 DUF1343 domain-containing protein [Phycisphaerae bacterium]